MDAEMLTFTRRYEGQYHENKRHGRGTFLFADGSRYIGEYKADKKHGLGTYTYLNGGCRRPLSVPCRVRCSLAVTLQQAIY